VLVEAETDGVDPGVQLVGPCPRQLLEFIGGHLAGRDAAGQTQAVELDVTRRRLSRLHGSNGRMAADALRSIEPGRNQRTQR
jgi:hypothetical protein